jgi:NitT/TauT family transport system ATP-binding protein
MLEIITTGWGEERGSRVVSTPRFGEITARLWTLLREESMRAMAGKS